MTKEEAIKIVRENMHLSYDEGNIFEALKTLIPELRESEDERIRKMLISLVKNSGEWIIPGNKEKVLTWLEHLQEHLEDIRHDAYNKGLVDAKEKYEKEQKPVEWSEEDERMFNSLCTVLHGGLSSIPTEQFIYWLKSLRPQQKQEVVDRTVFDRIADILRWCVLPIGCPVENFKESESEREHLLHIVQCVAHRYANSCMYCKEYGRGYQEGLNAHWKPSEVQMDDLSTAEAILREFGYDMVADGIAELREDLEKL